MYSRVLNEIDTKPDQAKRDVLCGLREALALIETIGVRNDIVFKELSGLKKQLPPLDVKREDIRVNQYDVSEENVAKLTREVSKLLGKAKSSIGTMQRDLEVEYKDEEVKARSHPKVYEILELMETEAKLSLATEPVSLKKAVEKSINLLQEEDPKKNADDIVTLKKFSEMESTVLYNKRAITLVGSTQTNLQNNLKELTDSAKVLTIDDLKAAKSSPNKKEGNGASWVEQFIEKFKLPPALENKVREIKSDLAVLQAIPKVSKSDDAGLKNITGDLLDIHKKIKKILVDKMAVTYMKESYINDPLYRRGDSGVQGVGEFIAGVHAQVRKQLDLTMARLDKLEIAILSKQDIQSSPKGMASEIKLSSPSHAVNAAEVFRVDFNMARALLDISYSIELKIHSDPDSAIEDQIKGELPELEIETADTSVATDHMADDDMEIGQLAADELEQLINERNAHLSVRHPGGQKM